MNYIVLDLEFNQFFEFPNMRAAPEPKCPSEIIQIGSVKLDERLNVIDSMSVYARPQIYTRMHPYVERITGLTTGKLKEYPPFTEAFSEFVAFAGGEKAVFCVWGPDDVKELYKNILYHGLNSNLLSKSYINIQKLASAHLKTANSAIGLKSAVEALSIPAERQFHDALNDALYTAEVFQRLSPSFEQCTAGIQKINISQLKQSIIGKINEVNLQTLYDYAQGKLKRRLSERDKSAVLNIYNAGRAGRFDVNAKKISAQENSNRENSNRENSSEE